MSILDIIILIVLAGFVWKGIKLGLIEVVGSIIGLFVGVFMAGRYYGQVAEMLNGLLFGSEILANVLGFLLVFIIVNRVIALIFWIIDKIFDIIAIIPFLKTFNHLLGGIFGLLEGLLFIGIIIFFLLLVPFTGGLEKTVTKSRFAPAMSTIGKIADPFIPDTIIEIPFNMDGLPSIGDVMNKVPKNLPDIK